MMTENNTKKAKNKRNIQILAAVLTAACLLAGCTSGSGNGSADGSLPPAGPTNNIAPEQPTQEAVTLVDPSENQTVIDADFSITTSEGEAVEGTAGQGGTVYYITASGDYTVKGQLKSGQIVVSVPDTAADSGTVKLILSGTS
ncbi:MAG: carbohydrate-binding domain-containing protein, partial [Clostridia bacterium]|nr:carbohydrate-binding domain-containing protein [Clostridia bacterium]